MQPSEDEESILSVLQDIRSALAGESYEPLGHWTIGGGPGTYQIKTPTNTECEFKLASLTTTQSTPHGYIVSVANPTIIAPVINTVSYGLLTQGSEGSNPYDGFAGFVQATQDVTSEAWQPLGRGVIVYFNHGATAGQSCLLTIAFRRAYLHVLPNKPRMQPHTHTHPQSRRPLRMMTALSEQYSGYESQYPRPYGSNYDHNEIPESQDLGNISSAHGQRSSSGAGNTTSNSTTPQKDGMNRRYRHGR